MKMTKLFFALSLATAAVFTSCNPDEVEPTLQFLADGDKYATGDVTVFVGETVTYSWTATGDSKLASFTVRHENLDLTVEDGNVFVIDGKTATGTLTRTFDKVGEYKFLFQVTDKDDLTASQTVTVTVVDPTPVTNPLEAEMPVEWKRIGGAAGTGLETYGLTWTSNTTTAAIIKNGADRFVKLTTAEWTSITTKEALKTAVDAATNMTQSEDISATKTQTYNLVYGTKKGDMYYMINITNGTVTTGTSTTITITGKSKK